MGVGVSTAACCAGSLASCTLSAICGSLCNVGNKAHPATTKIWSIVILFLSSMLGLLLRYKGKDLTLSLAGYTAEVCSTDACMGSQAVYRISAVLTAFFLLHAALALCSEKAVHGLWALKLVGILGTIFGSFYVPNAVFNVFAAVSRYAISPVFLVLQIALLIDFAYLWNESWVEQERLKAVLVSAVGFYALAAVGVVLEFVFFTGNECGQFNLALVCITLVLIMGTTIVSASEWCEHGALLTSGIVSCYSVYLTYSAMSSNPSGCKWSAESASQPLQIGLGMLFAGASLCWTSYSAGTTDAMGGRVDAGGLKAPITGGRVGGMAYAGARDEESGAAEEEDEEEDEDGTSFRYYFLVMSIASAYMGMLLTSWGDTHANTYNDVSTSSMWAKVLSLWGMFALFTWSLLAPTFLTDREF